MPPDGRTTRTIVTPAGKEAMPDKRTEPVNTSPPVVIATADRLGAYSVTVTHELIEAPTKFDKKAYQREYMRKRRMKQMRQRRAKQKAET